MYSSDSLPPQYLPQPKLYRTEYPNQPQLLYKGFAEILVNEEDAIEGDAIVLLDWFPCPSPRFEFTYFTKKEQDFDFNEITLKLTELGVKAKANIRQKIYSYSKGQQKVTISGFFCEPVIQGNSDRLASLTFSIPNFPWFNICNTLDKESGDLDGWMDCYFDGQFVFLTKEWRIILATMPDSHDIGELLEKKGGYGLTHVCKLEKLNRDLFSLQEAKEHLEAFSYYLSFARGIRLSPILLFGYDAQGKQIFEQWSEHYNIDSWQNESFLFCIDSTELPETFTGFMNKWQEQNWRELIKESIDGYIESSKLGSGINWAIVMQQVSLEQLAWLILVDSKEILSSHGWSKLSADDRIRYLLSHFDIDLKIPDSMTNLQQISKEFNWENAPQAITEIRNLILHPSIKNKSKKDKINKAARYEAWNLGLEYLEFILLKIFDYPYRLE